MTTVQEKIETLRAQQRKTPHAVAIGGNPLDAEIERLVDVRKQFGLKETIANERPGFILSLNVNPGDIAPREIRLCLEDRIRTLVYDIKNSTAIYAICVVIEDVFYPPEEAVMTDQISRWEIIRERPMTAAEQIVFMEYDWTYGPSSSNRRRLLKERSKA